MSALEIEQVTDGSVKLRNRSKLGNYLVAGPEFFGRLGQNYQRVIQEVLGLEDTFGLCGIVAIHAAGILASPENWNSVSYDPKRFKFMFDRKMESGVGHRGSEIFNRMCRKIIPGGFKERQIHNAGELHETFDTLHSKDGLIVAFICEYETHKGYHTHWLAAERLPDKNSVLLVGDLSPFGINDYAVTATLDHVPEGVANVLGSSPTTMFSRQGLAEREQKEGYLGIDNKFRVNTYVCGFAQKSAQAMQSS